MATMKSRIILRNDSSKNWNSNDSVVLLKGEVGIEFLESGAAKLKVGDGKTPWNTLPSITDEYVSNTDIQAIIAKYFEENPIHIETDATLSVAGQPADAAAVREKCLFREDSFILAAGDADDNIFT